MNYLDNELEQNFEQEEKSDDYYYSFPVKLKAKLHQVNFPKNKIMLEYGRAIVQLDVVGILEGQLHPRAKNYKGMINVKGNMARLEAGEEYEFTLKLDGVDPKWGATYKLLYKKSNFNFTDVTQQKIFFDSFLTEKQIANIFETFENPIDILESGDIESLCQVKGIGYTTAEKILEKYEGIKDCAQAYIELAEYDLTSDAIKKLCDRYGSPDALINIIKTNPYILVDAEGYGFKKADNIALAGGLDKNSIDRAMAFIEHTLKEKGQDGYSWIESSELIYEIEEKLDGLEMDTVLEAVNTLKEQGKVWNGEFGKIGSMKLYRLEEKIVDELFRLMNAEKREIPEGWEDRVKIAEKMQGWEYEDEQKEAIKTILNNNVCIITGYGGCVDADTEYFNGEKWIRIADYKKGDKVLQYEVIEKDRGKATLTHPERYVKLEEEKLTLIKNKTGSVNQLLSDEHDVVYVTSKGNTYKKQFLKIKEQHKNSKHGFTGKFITTFDYEGEGIKLSDEEIRLMIAVIADGHFHAQRSSSWCKVNLKKQRKKDRLEKLLKEAGIEYKKRISTVDGYHVYSFYAPYKYKEFDYFWYNCNKKQFKVIADEVLLWDGSLYGGKKRFTTTSKKTADFIQFVFSTLGSRATLFTRDRTGQKYMTNGKEYIRQSIEYDIHISKKNKLVSIQAKTQEEKIDLVEIPTTDGFKYCFTVPTGMLVLRREGRIFITGNCGKTASMLGALKALGNVTFGMCALSGRASSVLQDATGYKSQTIHRLLKFEEGEFQINKDNPLPHDVVVLDEGSMVDGELFYSLIQSIKTGSKLIMLGDVNQIPPMTSLNVFYDCLKSGVIPKVELTKIHRQARASGIITNSIQIAKGKQIAEKGFEDKETRGELQDFHIDIYDKSWKTFDKIIETFKKKIGIVKDVDKLQVIVPFNLNGDVSVYNLNKTLQEICNPPSKGKKEIQISYNKDKKAILREGDRIMNIKNNYQMEEINEDGFIAQNVEIFNGYIGIIKKIHHNGNLEVFFPIIDKLVILPKSHWQGDKIGIQHAWCSTIHKFQGSQADCVIIAIDFTHYKLLTNEMLYTAISRASKDCTLITTNKALAFAIRTKDSKQKQTFLIDLINSKLNKPID